MRDPYKPGDYGQKEKCMKRKRVKHWKMFSRRKHSSVITCILIVILLISAVPVSWQQTGNGVYAAQGGQAPAGDLPHTNGTGLAVPQDDIEGKRDAESADGKHEDEDGEKESSEEGVSKEAGRETAGQDDQTPDSDGKEGSGTDENPADGTVEVPDRPVQDAPLAGPDGEETVKDTASQDREKEISADPAENEAEESEDSDAGSSGQTEDMGSSHESEEQDKAGEKALSPQEDAAAADSLPADAELETISVDPYVDMTSAEFNRAFLSVTRGAALLSSSSASGAKIVSKQDTIDYDDLGIGNHVSGHNNQTTTVGIRDDDRNEYIGVCVVPDDRGWSKGTVLPNVTRVTDSLMIKLYYYTMLDGFGEELAKSKGFGNDSRKVAVAACHEAVSIRYASLAGVEYDRPNVKSNLRSLVSAYQSAVAGKPLPDTNDVTVYICGRTKKDGHWMQPYIFGRKADDVFPGVVLKKCCSDPDMLAAYRDYYCLHETEDGGEVNFRLYSDKACTKRVHVYSDESMKKELDPIPVGKNGSSGLWNQTRFYCKSGTYYLKEINTPKGYQKQSEPFGPYEISEGISARLTPTNTPRYAKAGIIKKDVKTGKTLAGAEFGLYSNYEDAVYKTDPEGVFRTGADGRSNELDVLAGKIYYARELTAPKGYKTSDAVFRLETAAGFTQTAWTTITDEPDVGTVQVKKASADPEADTSSDDSPYSLAGAVYTLFDESGNTVGTLTTKEDGTTNVLTVNCGNYTLRETTPSKGFALDTKVYNITVNGGELTSVSSAEPPVPARISVYKISSVEKDGKEEDTMPIEGAVYTLYSSKEDAQEKQASAGTFVIRADGTSNEVEVLAGKTYYVVETKVPEGYLPDEKIHELRAESPSETYSVSSEDRLIFGGVKICKRDLETGENRPLGGAALQETLFRIYNDGSRSVYADGKKILPGGEAMTLTAGADGMAQTSDKALSYGQYRIEEITAPEGYTREGAKPVRFDVKENGRIVDLSKSADTSICNRVMRGDFSIRKINGYTQKRMAGVTFEVTAFDRSGKVTEKHRFTTDKNGIFDSSSQWAEQNQEDRIWFGVGSKPDPALGALPYGDYHIEEVEGENNRGMKMYSEDFTVYADKQSITLGNIENTLKPALETELVDENGDHYADSRGRVTLTDHVTYSGMEEYIGKEVVFHGVIYVKETGEPLMIDGKKVECVKTKKILSPAGTVQLRFSFDASAAKDKTLVCFEYASEKTEKENENPPYHDSTNGGTDIASHADIDDEAQSVHLVSVETKAEDKLTGMHIGLAREGAVTIDHVTSRGLIPGMKYKVTGVLVDKSTGRPLRSRDDREITAEASFTAAAAEETVDLTFTYDASLLEGTTAVAFEKLYLDGTDSPENPPIAVHEDPDDEEQTIHYPKIRTHAAGGGARNREEEMTKSFMADGELLVRDRVTWNNLIPGETYRLQGTLMRKDTGKALTVGGKSVTAAASFTAQTKDGETYLDFRFDGKQLMKEIKGTDMPVAAFEELYITGVLSEEDRGKTDGNDESSGQEKLIAEHKDLQDQAQSVLIRHPEEPETESGEKTAGKKVKAASPDTIKPRGSSVRTGDETRIAVYLVPALMAALGAAALMYVNRKK